jgi:hypothetical protein
MNADSASTTPTIKTEEARYRGKPYEMTDKGLLWWKPGREGAHVPTLLANFNAEIIEDVMVDDGVETSRAFKLQATVYNPNTNRPGKSRSFTVSQNQFEFMKWPRKYLGGRANIYPGHEGHTLSAIIDLSKTMAERYLYRQTGWRDIDGQQVYLHAGGGIGSKGSVKVDTQLHSTLSRYHLPSPRRRPEIIKAVRASLRMLDIAPDRITVPIFSGIWRSILQNCMFSIHLAGPTGAGKSQIAALAQQHFGPKMDGDHLPLSWSGTANAIRELLFQCKDAIIVVDDFVPTGTSAEVSRLHGTAEQVMRAQGNHSSRARMTADTAIRPAKEPRGLLLSTGEDTPGTQSLRARQVIIELSKGELNWLKLTECQSNAAAGHYAMATAGFVRWIAPRLHKVEAMMQKDLTEFRNATAKLPGAHRRTPDNVCSLATGFRMWLTFAQAVKAIQAEQAAELWTRACKAFQDLIDYQAIEQAASDPSRQFITLVSALFAGDRAHITNEKGGAPPHAARWGWTRANGSNCWTPQGIKVGWLKRENVYLDPTISFAAASQLGKEIGQGITISLMTLQRRLKQSGLLASTEEGRETNTVRLYVEGARRNVLHFSPDTLSGYKKPDQSAVSANGAFGSPNNWQAALDQPDHPTNLVTNTSLTQSASYKELGRLVRFPKGREALRAKTIKRGGGLVRSDQGKIPTNSEPDQKPAYKSAAERRAERLRNI